MRQRHLLAASICLLSCGLLGGTATRAADPKPLEADGKPLIRLWTGDAPGAKGTEDVDVPALTHYAAPAGKGDGAAVVVCPGGGYGMLAVDHEGRQVAAWLNELGVSAFVLRYRLGGKYQHPVMMNDVARAIRTVRARAKEWNVDANRVGVLGFSAGGHLASTAATQFTDGTPDAPDAIDRASSRPDVAILIYPVITMTDPHTHGGSRRNLLGEKPAAELVELMSNEKRVTERTPPTFLVHSVDDKVVPPENSLLLAAALTKHRVPFALTMLEKGGHGYGLGNGRDGAADPVLSTWPKLCAAWLTGRGFLRPAGAPAAAAVR